MPLTTSFLFLLLPARLLMPLMMLGERGWMASEPKVNEGAGEARSFVEPGGSRICEASAGSDQSECGEGAKLRKLAGLGGRSPIRSLSLSRVNESFCAAPLIAGDIEPPWNGSAKGSPEVVVARVREEDVLGRGGAGSMSLAVREEDVLVLGRPG